MSRDVDMLTIWSMFAHCSK